MSLQSFFHPTSIAIVGVSHDKHKVGHLVAKNMTEAGYQGDLYFINPEGGTTLGKKVFTSLTAIGKPVDLAILTVPGKVGIKILDEVHAIGCKNVLMYAAGFKENGAEGMPLENELLEKLEKYGITLLGPNCIGFINTKEKINATFLKSFSPQGNIGFVSQSGALGSILVDFFASHENLGFSYFVSIGNKSKMDETDILEYFSEDPQTEVIGMYLEDIKDGKRFCKALKETTKHKPVVILKSGSTKEGSTAALSHTGGMVGDDDVYDAAFRQSGAIRARNFNEFLTLIKLFSFKRIPSSRNILVLSNAGGVGVLLADDLIKEKLHLVMVSEKTVKKLHDVFDEHKKITVHNPIDILGDASAFDYRSAISSTLSEKNVGAIMVLLTPQANTEILKTAEVINEAQDAFDKPVYPVFMGRKSVEKALKYFENEKIAGFDSYDKLPHVLDQICDYQDRLELPAKHTSALHSLDVMAHLEKIGEILDKNAGKSFLDLGDSLEVIKMIGIPVTKTHFVENLFGLHSVADKLKYPLVLKIASDTITHKTEVQGVIPNIQTLEELQHAFRRITAIEGSKGCYIQPMSHGYELFVGAKRDKTFGPVVVTGMGGIYAELIKEICRFVHPFSPSYFEYTISQTKIGTLAEGFRGKPGISLEDLYGVISKVGLLLQKFPQIKEIDINPLFAVGTEIKAVDGRIILT